MLTVIVSKLETFVKNHYYSATFSYYSVLNCRNVTAILPEIYRICFFCVREGEAKRMMKTFSKRRKGFIIPLM